MGGRSEKKQSRSKSRSPARGRTLRHLSPKRNVTWVNTMSLTEVRNVAKAVFEGHPIYGRFSNKKNITKDNLLVVKRALTIVQPSVYRLRTGPW